MRAEIKNIFSIDAGDLLTHRPTDASSFCIPIRLVAGPENMPGEESFDFEICTPSWLQYSQQPGVVRDLRHTLLIDSYDPQRIIDYVRNYVDACSGDTWNEVAVKISRLGHWEFEDYKS